MYLSSCINADMILNKQYSAYSICGAVLSFMKSKWNSAAVNRILIEYIKKILLSFFCNYFKGKLSFSSTPVKKWAIPNFSSCPMLIRKKNHDSFWTTL